MEVKQSDITGVRKEGKGATERGKVQFLISPQPQCGVTVSRDAEEQRGA